MDRKSSRKASDKRASRFRKRRFHGNRNTGEHSTEFTSASASKLQKSNELDVPVDPIFEYCIVQFSLFIYLQTILKCKNVRCQMSDVKFLKSGEQGLGFKLCVECQCDDDYSYYSSPKIDKAFEINRRFVFVMRLLGVGIAGIRNFCGLLDLACSFSNDTYYKCVDNITIAVDSVFKFVINKAAGEEKDMNKAAGNVENYFTVSGDGSWQKRGFSSLLGIVSLIGSYTGKVIDIVVKSKYCNLCAAWKGKENTLEYEEFFADHEENCQADHEGSAGKMEVDGVIEMFQRSEELHDARYLKYVGDGDSSTFKSLLEVQPYGTDFQIVKKECVLHVKKRVFRRAKEGKKKFNIEKKTKKLIEAEKSKMPQKTPTKKGTSKERTAKLTNKVMKNLSTYYGLAIRRNSDSIEKMRNEIWAAYYHKISTDQNPQHSFCPSGADSWCNWRKAEAAGKEALKNYKHAPPLDDEAQQILKPIYEDLTSDDLLERCLGNNTQNNNESLNACVWNYVPKHTFAGKKIIEIAAFTAACVFNEGFISILKIMHVMGINIGRAAKNLARKNDNARIIQANKRSSDASKEARSARRDEKSRLQEQYDEEEGIMYGPGMAD